MEEQEDQSSEEVIAELQRLSRKVSRIKQTHHRGPRWRLVEDEVHKYILDKFGPVAAQDIESAFNPGMISLVPEYVSSDGVAPAWKAEVIEEVRTSLRILARDVRNGPLPSLVNGPRGSETRRSKSRVFISHSGETPGFQRLIRYLNDLGVDPVVAEWLPFRGRTVPEHVSQSMSGCSAAIVFATRADHVGQRPQPGRGVLIETGILQERFGETVVYLVEDGAEFGPMADSFARETFTDDNLERAFHRILIELKAHGIL